MRLNDEQKDALVENVIFAAGEYGTMEFHLPEPPETMELEREDRYEIMDTVRSTAELSDIYMKDGVLVIEVDARGSVSLPTRRIRGDRWNPPEVEYSKFEVFGHFHARVVDGGFDATGTIEV